MSNNESIKDTLDIIRRALEDENDFPKKNETISEAYIREATTVRKSVGICDVTSLGKIAIQYGYQRFNGFIMFVTVVILIIFVQTVQLVGNCFVTRQRTNKKSTPAKCC